MSVSELRPLFGEPPHVTAPPLEGYRQVAHERLDVGRISLIGLAIIPFWIVAFLAIVAMLGGRSDYSFDITWYSPFMLVGVMLIVILLHEILHGVTAAILGARPAFGVGPGIAYTTFLEPMNKASYLAVGIAPLALLSVAAVAGALIWPAAAGWLIAAAVINASGAVGDLWMTVRILRAPRGAHFYDLADGFAVLAPDSPS